MISPNNQSTWKNVYEVSSLHTVAISVGTIVIH